MLSFDALVLAPAHATFGEVNQGYPVPSYTPPGGGTASDIDGVFRLESLDLFGGGAGDAPGVTSRKPMLDIRQSQVPDSVTIIQGGTFQVRGVAYEIGDVRPDGMGLLVLHLSEAPV